jgi:hypothetical protein
VASRLLAFRQLTAKFGIGFTAETPGTQRLSRESIRIWDATDKREGLVMGLILVIILVLLLLGVVPRWPHSRSWGYGPSGGIGLLLVIVLILWLLGVI